MKITQKTLKKLIDAPVKLVKRDKLPYEAQFKTTPHTLSPKKQRLRETAIQEICSPLDPIGKDIARYHWLSEYVSEPLAWAHLARNYRNPEKTWTPKALALAETLWPDAVIPPAIRAHSPYSAVIFPNSPKLSTQAYWQEFTGLPKVRTDKKTLNGLSKIHEAGHFLFPCTRKQESDIFIEEALADCFALKTYKDLGGSKDDIRDFIAMRRIAAFYGGSLPRYWTADLCEGLPFKAYHDYFNPVRELQIRVLDDLRGYNRRALDRDTYQKGEKHTLLSLSGCVQKRESLWTTERTPFYQEFKNYNPHLVMEVLAAVTDEANLSPETQAEGRKVLKAYNHFRPLGTPAL